MTDAGRLCSGCPRGPEGHRRLYRSRQQAAAKRLVLDLQERAARLGTAPRAGRLRSELKVGLRSVAFGSYIIFYQVEDTTIRVERIIHGARDLGAVFDDEG